MLTTLHRLSETWLFKGILIITALSFVSFFGVGGLDEIQKKRGAVISVGDIDISAADFQTMFVREMEKIRKKFGADLKDEKVIKDALIGEIIKNEVSKAIVAETADDLNLSIPNDAVKRMVLGIPDFQNLDGTFNRRAFEYFLSNARMSEVEFLESLKLRGIETQLLAPVSTLAYVNNVMAEDAYKKEFEHRDLSVATVLLDKIKVNQKPTADEIQSYYDSEKETAFMNPEYRTLTTIILPFSKVFEAIPVTDDEIFERYNSAGSQYVKPETRDVDQMNFADEATAKKAAATLKKGESFRSVAKSVAGQTDDDTHLGNVEKSGVLAEVADDLFIAKVGGIVGPVQSEMGWHIFKVLSITPEVRIPLNKVKSEIKAAIQKEKGSEQIYEQAYKIDDFLGSGKSLEEAAQQFGLEIKTIPMIDITGKDKNGKTLPGIYAKPEFLTVAFGLNKDIESPMTELDDLFFVVRADDIVAPKAKPLSEVKDKVIAIWHADKQSEIANNMVQDVLAGKSVASVKFKPFTDVSRSGKELSPDVLIKAFTMNAGDVDSVSGDKEITIIKVNKIKPADPKTKPSAVAELKTEAQEMLAARMAEAFLKDFGAKYKVTVDRNAIDNLFKQSSDE